MPVRPAITAGSHPPLGVIDTSQPFLSAAWMLVVPRVNASSNASSSLRPRTLSGRGPVVDQLASRSANGFLVPPSWNAYGSPGFTAASFLSWLICACRDFAYALLIRPRTGSSGGKYGSP